MIQLNSSFKNIYSSNIVFSLSTSLVKKLSQLICFIAKIFFDSHISLNINSPVMKFTLCLKAI